MTWSASSIAEDPIRDFLEQNLLDHTLEEKCIFFYHDISLLRANLAISKQAIFCPYDKYSHSDLASYKWVCLLAYPFTFGLTYPFQPLISEFF
ncbi:hypothetical protein Hanom_Chr05g00398861 [Helianthus anomalus]